MKPALRWIAPRLAATLAVFLLCAAGGDGCKTLGPTPPPGTPGFVNCSDAALHQDELNILPLVETALSSASWEQALLGIVASAGLPEVDCVVAWIESKALKAAPTTADSLEATKAANAAAWLKKYPMNMDGSATVGQ